MTTYKGINGFAVQSVGSDPSPLDEGQVWYNNAGYAFKLASVTTAGAWATGGSLNTARSALGGAGATRDSALAFGGGPPPAPTATAITESYNGTSWTEVNDLNTQRAFVAGAGTQTSAIASGGDQYSGVSESWNGTSWASITNEPDASNGYGAAGADSTNALFFGGASVPQSATRYWNGSAWTALGNLSTARSGILGAGKTHTAALAAGGQSGPTRYAFVESFNGSSWTEITDINTARSFGGGTGTQTSALVFGGDVPPVSALTEEWNGTVGLKQLI
jgi:hypothetical protein